MNPPWAPITILCGLQKSYIFIGRIFVFYGRVSIFIGRIFVFYGRIFIFIGRIFVFIGRIFIFIGRIFVFIGRIFVFYRQVDTCQTEQTGTQRAPYGEESYITDGKAVRVRVWGKAEEYLCKCTSLSLRAHGSKLTNSLTQHGSLSEKTRELSQGSEPPRSRSTYGSIDERLQMAAYPCQATVLDVHDSVVPRVNRAHRRVKG